MRSKMPIALLPLVLLFAAPAAAQTHAYPHVRPPTTPLVAAVERVQDQVVQEVGRGPLYHHLERLRLTAERLESRHRRRHRRRPPRVRLLEHHRRARRALVSSPRPPSDALLDAWDDVTIALRETGHLARRPRPEPHRPYQPPPPPPPVYSFDGSFENMPVHFAGATPAAVHQACEQWASHARLHHVDDVTIGRRRHHLSAGYFTASQLCGIVALNARAAGEHHGVTLEGRVEGAVPFHLSGAPHEVRATVRTFLPIAVGNLRVDDVSIGQRRFHQSYGYWSGAQLAELVAANLEPIEGQHRGLVARGRIEQTPFVFVAQDSAELQRACSAFVRSVITENVDDVTVGGRHQHNGPGYWNEAEVCMIVASMAQAGG